MNNNIIDEKIGDFSVQPLDKMPDAYYMDKGKDEGRWIWMQCRLRSRF